MCRANPPRDEAGFCIYGLQGWPGCSAFKENGKSCSSAAAYQRWRERECERQARKAKQE